MSSCFAFFGRDFLTAAGGWTAEERGHYITLPIDDTLPLRRGWAEWKGIQNG